jgi:hypothetical protein
MSSPLRRLGTWFSEAHGLVLQSEVFHGDITARMARVSLTAKVANVDDLVCASSADFCDRAITRADANSRRLFLRKSLFVASHSPSTVLLRRRSGAGLSPTPRCEAVLSYEFQSRVLVASLHRRSSTARHSQIARITQRFLSTHAAVYNAFNVSAISHSRATLRILRGEA